MSKTSAAVVVGFQLVTEFDSVRDRLLGLELNGQWEKPLAYWAQPTDRHLPMALVERTLKSVVETPFAQLSQTPGIGPKKLSSLIMLLGRAANSLSANGKNGASHAHERPAEPPRDDPSVVSEEVWCRWAANLRGRGLEKETLGRFAPSLREIPKSMWRKPLDEYLSRSLAEIRALRSHGEKRLTALIQIVGGLNGIVEQLTSQPHVVARIQPRFVAQMEEWFTRFASAAPGTVLPAGAAKAPEGRGLPDDATICRELLEPLVEQTRIDVGDQAAAILHDRLFTPEFPVQQTAYRLNLTRGRVYELIGEAAVALEVRWPEGRPRLLELRSRLAVAGGQYAKSLSRVEIVLVMLLRDRTGSRAGWSVPSQVAPSEIAHAQFDG